MTSILSRPAPDLSRAPASALARVELVDALRGFALLGICLIHCLEYFELWPAKPDGGPLHEFMFLLFAGKAYAIFAMMFGLSFFIIRERSTLKGQAMRGRFAWRLLLLAAIGYLHTLLYHGDILLVLGILGLSLLFLEHLSNRVLLVVSLLFMAQLPFWWQFFASINGDAVANTPPEHWAVYGQLAKAHVSNTELAGHFFINATLGLKAKLLYFVESGRGVQLIGLFIWGLLLGRIGFFTELAAFARSRRIALMVSAVFAVILFTLQKYLAAQPETLFQAQGLAKWVMSQIVNLYLATAIMVLWVTVFIELYNWQKTHSLLHLLAPCGKISLSIYLVQALICIPIFYPFGLGLYTHATQLNSLVLGLVFYAGLIAAAHWWVKRFYYGPAEWLWRAATYGTFKIPMRKRD